MRKENVRPLCRKAAPLFLSNRYSITIYEPPHGKTNNLHLAKTKTQISFEVTAKLISAFVFTTWIVQFLFYLNPKFQASCCFLCLNRPVCVGPVWKPHCWFSHEVAHITISLSLYFLKQKPQAIFCCCTVLVLTDLDRNPKVKKSFHRAQLIPFSLLPHFLSSLSAVLQIQTNSVSSSPKY